MRTIWPEFVVFSVYEGRDGDHDNHCTVLNDLNRRGHRSYEVEQRVGNKVVLAILVFCSLSSVPEVIFEHKRYFSRSWGPLIGVDGARQAYRLTPETDYDCATTELIGNWKEVLPTHSNRYLSNGTNYGVVGT